MNCVVAGSAGIVAVTTTSGPPAFTVTVCVAPVPAGMPPTFHCASAARAAGTPVSCSVSGDSCMISMRGCCTDVPPCVVERATTLTDFS